MPNHTTDTYALKRDILSFVSKISRKLKRPDQKFAADITYGMLTSKSCLLTDVADALHENIKKKNTIERLSLNLAKGTPKTAMKSYLNTIRKWVPDNPVVHIDDTDITKEYGHKFEAIGRVRDGSKSRDKNVYKNGYYVTEATVLTKSHHPVSFFSEIYSSEEKDFISVNDKTFAALSRGARLFSKATYVMDRGYDNNKIFLLLDELSLDYVVRLTTSRKVTFDNKWISVTELCRRRKGKIKINLHYHGRDHDAYLSHVKVKITALKKDIYLVLVYGISEKPMMLATNKKIRSKEDVEDVARTYFSRWRIEEYFRAKKQLFRFENFRVRNLKAINALNFYITVCMAYLGYVSLKPETSKMKVAIVKAANPVREKVLFNYYRFAKGISSVLSYAKEGTRHWFKRKRPSYRQLRLNLVC